VGRQYRLVNQWRFKRKGSGLLLTALIAATFIQTVWVWRPLIWMTGQTDAGKSLFLHFLETLFGPTSILYEGKVSEAALRQKIQHSAGAVLLDEFEKNPQRDRVLEFLRSSGRAGTVAKGTPGHKPVEFSIRHVVWCGSIDVGLPRAADQNRWIVTELAPLDGQHITAPDEPDLETLGIDVLTSMIWAAARARALERQLQLVKTPGVGSRVRDNLIVPTAALSAILGHSDAQAEKLLRHWLRRFVDGPIERESDEETLISTLLSSRISLSKCDSSGHQARYEMTVGQALEDMNHWDGLQRFGIRADSPVAPVFIVGQVVCRELLKGTPWEHMNVNSILKRIKGATGDRQRCAGANLRGVSVPIDVLRPRPKFGPSQQPSGTSSGTSQSGTASSVAPSAAAVPSVPIV